MQKRFGQRYQVQVTYTLSNTSDNTQAQLAADVNNTSVYPQIRTIASRTGRARTSMSGT